MSKTEFVNLLKDCDILIVAAPKKAQEETKPTVNSLTEYKLESVRGLEEADESEETKNLA